MDNEMKDIIKVIKVYGKSKYLEKIWIYFDDLYVIFVKNNIFQYIMTKFV